MDIWALTVFKTVAQEESISRAALKLNCVQSNVTARIRQLEDELDVLLFHRKSRGVTLTSKGRVLLEYANEAVRLLKDAAAAVGDHETVSGPLVIGTMESTAAVRLPRLLPGYHTNYPDVDLKIDTGTTLDLVNKVLDYQIEAAFVAGPVDHPDIEQIHAFDEELVVITDQTINTVKRLDRPTLIVFRKGCSYRNVLESWTREKGIIPGKVMELGTLEGVLGFVSAGMGITVFPKSVVSGLKWQKRVRIYPISKEKARIPTVFIRRKDCLMTGALNALIKLIRKNEENEI